MRDGGGGGTRGRVLTRAPGEEEHYLVIHLSKLDPQVQLRLEEHEISSLCLDQLKIPKEWITGVSQTDLAKVKIRGRFDLKDYEVDEVVVRPGEILGSSMPRRESASWVYFYGADLSTPSRAILEELEAFGTITSPMQEYLSGKPGGEGRLAGIWTGDRRVGMVVKRAIPQFMFAPGPEEEEDGTVKQQMIKVVYAHQKNKCSWCGKARHCRGGKNAKKCREKGGTKFKREDKWARHQWAARNNVQLEDSDVEDEEEEDFNAAFEEEGDSEGEGRGDGEDSGNHQGGSQGGSQGENQQHGLRKPDLEAQTRTETQKRETAQERTLRQQREFHHTRAASSDMVEIQIIPEGKTKEELEKWVKMTIKDMEARPQVVKNPNPAKQRSWIIKNLTLQQRFSLYGAQRRVDGTKVKAAAYMEEQAMEDFPGEATMVGGKTQEQTDIEMQADQTGNLSAINPAGEVEPGQGSGAGGDSPPALNRHSTLATEVSEEERSEEENRKRAREASGNNSELLAPVSEEEEEEGVNIGDEEAGEEENGNENEEDIDMEGGGDNDEGFSFVEGDGNNEVRALENQREYNTESSERSDPFAKSSKVNRTPQEKLNRVQTPGPATRRPKTKVRKLDNGQLGQMSDGSF